MPDIANKPTNKRFIYDAILILALLCVGLFALVMIRITARSGQTLIVKHNKEVICEISLAEDGEYSLFDGKNLLVVSGGEAYIKSADCPDKLCVNQGRISRSGETVICLPNRLTITVE